MRYERFIETTMSPVEHIYANHMRPTIHTHTYKLIQVGFSHQLHQHPTVSSNLEKYASEIRTAYTDTHIRNARNTRSHTHTQRVKYTHRLLPRACSVLLFSFNFNLTNHLKLINKIQHEFAHK